MPELFIELLSEEIPARMQADAAAALARLATESLAPLTPQHPRTFHGPRRIALALTLAPEVPATRTLERGPRTSAPPQALDGFLRKHAATPADLTTEAGHHVLARTTPAQPAANLAAAALPTLLRRFPWPKSMRWGASAFTWVRPLRRITCLLDGAVVPFTLATPSDDAHHLAAGNETEGHRFHAPAPFPVRGADDWHASLLARHVVPGAPERRRRIEHGLQALAAAEHLHIVPDAPLLDEVAGLVEWPVCLLGRIDGAFMDLPPEVMQVSMRVNQRYFALRTADGAPAPRFGFAANIEASDNGAAITAGNERVLRARFSDARHFWDTDRQTPLAHRVPALEGITFHAKLGTQAARVARIEALARHLAPALGADPTLAARAAHLCKADLTTGMVAEFPELQGTIGAYYAAHDDEPPEVAAAIRDHYAPRGPTDPTPTAPTTTAVALADKIDQLASFFAINEAPTGSSDPFALRRAALGLIRIIRDNALRLPLKPLFTLAAQQAAPNRQPSATPPSNTPHTPETADTLLTFIIDRLRVQLRTEGARHDVLAAVFAATPDDDIVRLLARTSALAAFLETPDGANILAAARRATNILRIENKKDGPHEGPTTPALLTEPAEQALAQALATTTPAVETAIAAERFADAMHALAQLRPTLDAFFDQVTVNSPNPALRQNRLRLLSHVGAAMLQAADLSKIEGSNQ